MDSWDLFDTLVACRQGGPAGEHPESLYPIAEVIARVKPDDLVVSDYYTYERAERVLREVTKLPNKLVQSQHGKYQGVIWKMLPKIDCHHGDNETGDVAQPLKHGIPAEWITVAQPTELEWSMQQYGVPGLGLACREARLSTWHPEFRRLQMLQTQTNFPALVLAGMVLHQFVTGHHLTRVLMSARDCCLWVGLQQDICQRQGGDYTVEYFPSSRVCRDHPSERYMEELNTRLADGAVIVDLAGTGESLARLIASSQYPETRGFIVSRYPWRYDESVSLQQIHVLTQFFGGGIFEFANSAQHGMYLDWDRTTEIDFDWNRPEIQVMHETFQKARQVLWQYPLPRYRHDWLICCLERMKDQIQWGNTVHDPGDLSFLGPAFEAEEQIRRACL